MCNQQHNGMDIQTYKAVMASRRITLLVSFFMLLFGTISCSLSCKVEKKNILRNEYVSSPSSYPSLWSKSGVGSSAACASDCGRDDYCLAFFYNKGDDLCTAHSGLISLGQLTSGWARYYSVVRDCSDVLIWFPAAGSGVYTVYPGRDPVDVYCDMDTDGGGWTVFQRRQDGSQDFYQDWETYKHGFGDLSREFWLGNDNIHLLTTERNMQLRIDMLDKEDQSGYATYSTFRVDDERNNYRLTVSGYDGDRGDSLSVHNGLMFSTLDRDNDISESVFCAVGYEGAWWYNQCHSSHLNGVFGSDRPGVGINWEAWRGYRYSLKAAAMKLRPL